MSAERSESASRNSFTPSKRRETSPRKAIRVSSLWLWISSKCFSRCAMLSRHSRRDSLIAALRYSRRLTSVAVEEPAARSVVRDAPPPSSFMPLLLLRPYKSVSHHPHAHERIRFHRIIHEVFQVCGSYLELRRSRIR